MPRFSKVLVFGGAGEVGSAAALEASARGAQVFLPMRDVSKKNEWLSPEQEKEAGLQRVTADLADPASVSKVVRETGAEAAFIYAVRSDDFLRGSLTALRDAGIQHVVFLSTSAVKDAGTTKGDLRSVPQSDFIPWQHAQVEIALEDLGIAHTALRPGSFASNPLRIYLDKTATPHQVYVFAPEELHDPIDPADIGRVAGTVLANPRSSAKKDVVYIFGPALLSQKQQWEIINRSLAAVGKPAVVVHEISEAQFLEALTARHIPPFVAQSLAKSFVSTRALYAAEDYEKDNRNVELVTGKPATSFEDFVKRAIPRYFD